MRILSSLTAILLSVGSTSFAAVNIIDATYGAGAGSFELGAYSQNSGNPGNYMRLSTTATTITGWTVGGADGIDWMTSPSNPASNGSFSVDLAGATNGPLMSFGSISTVIPTIVGVEYRISFAAYGGVEQHSGSLTAANLVQLFAAGGNPNPEIPAFENFQYSFTASDTTTTITFASVDSFGFGPVIDDVSVEAIPEPTAAMGCGLALLGASLLRRRHSRC